LVGCVSRSSGAAAGVGALFGTLVGAISGGIGSAIICTGKDIDKKLCGICAVAGGIVGLIALKILDSIFTGRPLFSEENAGNVFLCFIVFAILGAILGSIGAGVTDAVRKEKKQD
jgi:hypothetical protein